MDNKFLIKNNDFSKKNCQKLEILYLVMNNPELLSNQIYTLLAQKIITDDYINNLENFLSYNLNKVEGNDNAIDKYIKHVNEKFEEMFASFNIKDKILTESAVSSAARIMSTLGQYTEPDVKLVCGTHDNKCKYLLKIIYSHITYYNLKKDLYKKINEVVENFKTIKKCEKRLLHYNTLKNTISFLENIIKSELVYITRGEINDNKIDSLIENATKSDKELFKKLNLKRENREQILQYSMTIATVSTGTALTLGLTGVGAIGVPIATTAATLAGIASNIANVSRYRISKDIEKIKKNIETNETKFSNINASGITSEEILSELSSMNTSKSRNFNNKYLSKITNIISGCTQEAFDDNFDKYNECLGQISIIKETYFNTLDKMLVNIRLHELLYNKICSKQIREKSSVEKSLKNESVREKEQESKEQKEQLFNTNHPYFAPIWDKKDIIDLSNEELERLKNMIETDEHRREWRPRPSNSYQAILEQYILPKFNGVSTQRPPSRNMRRTSNESPILSAAKNKTGKKTKPPSIRKKTATASTRKKTASASTRKKPLANILEQTRSPESPNGDESEESD